VKNGSAALENAKEALRNSRESLRNVREADSQPFLSVKLNALSLFGHTQQRQNHQGNTYAVHPTICAKDFQV
jgi:hypothetical protein